MAGMGVMVMPGVARSSEKTAGSPPMRQTQRMRPAVSASPTKSFVPPRRKPPFAASAARVMLAGSQEVLAGVRLVARGADEARSPKVRNKRTGQAELAHCLGHGGQFDGAETEAVPFLRDGQAGPALVSQSGPELLVESRRRLHEFAHPSGGTLPG